MADRPGQYGVSNPRAVPSRPKTGPQEWPVTEPVGDIGSSPQQRRSEMPLPPGLNPAAAGWIEGVIIEQMASVAASLERTIGLQKETKALAELSGKLHKAEEKNKACEETITTMGLSFARLLKIAKVLGVGFGLVVALAVTAVATYRDAVGNAPEIAADVAQVVIEAKQVPIEARVATVEQGLTELDEDVMTVGRKVDALTSAVSGLLSHIESQEVPQQRRRPR